MGQPVVHFEIIGKDGEKLKSYYSDLFGWEIDADNPMSYGIVQRDGNINADGAGIGGGVGGRPGGLRRPRHLLHRGPRRRGRAREGREPRRVAGDGPGQGHGRARDRPLQRSRGPPGRRRHLLVLTGRGAFRGLHGAWGPRSGREPRRGDERRPGNPGGPGGGAPRRGARRRRGRVRPAGRRLPSRAPRALLPDAGLAPRRRGRPPGGVAARLARACRGSRAAARCAPGSTRSRPTPASTRSRSGRSACCRSTTARRPIPTTAPASRSSSRSGSSPIRTRRSAVEDGYAAPEARYEQREASSSRSSPRSSTCRPTSAPC